MFRTFLFLGLGALALFVFARFFVWISSRTWSIAVRGLFRFLLWLMAAGFPIFWLVESLFPTRGILSSAAMLIAATVASRAAAWFRGGSSSEMTRREAAVVLGVSEFASREEIESAWRDAIRRVHPDVSGSDESARRVNLAREVLLSSVEK